MKTILVLVGGMDTDRAVFETACAAARMFRAHLALFQMNIDVVEAACHRPHFEFAMGAGLRTAFTDFLNTGRYGRSRALAVIFGGFTQSLPCEAIVPVFILH